MAASQSRTASLQIYTIPTNNLTIRVGDHVLLKPNTDEELPYVGKILSISADYPQMTNATVKVRWYYRPEDTPQKRRIFHGLKELFLSDHLSEEHVECINGKCRVHSFEDYQKLELVAEEDYFLRFKYKCHDEIIAEEQVEVFCHCTMPLNPDLRMILCEGCLEWFHLRCLNMSLEESERIPHFYCQPCKAANDRHRSQRPTVRSN